MNGQAHDITSRLKFEQNNSQVVAIERPMELIQGLIQPPKVQSVEETIPTLCDRVENATLIGDRRSAVLGLKAFSREYREAVIASGLKPLLNTLKHDYIDESSVKAILETLLILFIRGDGDNDLTRGWISQQSRLQNGKYPSPLVMKQEKQQVDQFSLWIADAITQSDELVHLVIRLLDTGNFHIRLYTIQLLEAVVSARPARSRNAITSLPTGISTLVSLLDDIHEPVRDEAILLLMAVVNDSSHVQILVAFENIFERLFSIISEEGGLRGSLVVNDCLSLINNILKYNTSNQTLFLETGNLPKLAQILNEPLLEESFFWNEQRIVNINTALDIVSLTVEPGNTTTEKHQTVLLESNVLMIVLRLAFYQNIPKKVRPIALATAADMIESNELAQLEFGKIDVPFFDPSSPVESDPQNIRFVPVVSLLVNWALYANSVHTFPTRTSAVQLLKAYFNNNHEIQSKFLSNQIESYNSGSIKNNAEDGVHPLKSSLLEAILDYDPELKLNPYKLYFAVDLFMFLFRVNNQGNEALREKTRQITTGTILEGEETLTSIQTISELALTSLTAEDIRIPISYITFLIFWLYGDMNAVNDFLSNRSTIQSLLSFSYQVQGDDITIKCLVTMLLGVSYEFSSKDSPFPRKGYFDYITKTLGRDYYLSRIKQFKEDSFFSKAQKISDILNPEFDETGLPQVYFSTTFVSFFLDNFYRIKTALLHSPEEEPHTKISFESFEELQNQCALLKEKTEKLEFNNGTSIKELETRLELLTEEHGEIVEKHSILQHDYSTLHEHYVKIEEELKMASESIKQLSEEKEKLAALKEEYIQELDGKRSILAKNGERIESLAKELKSVRMEKEKAEDGINKMSRELFTLTKEKQELETRNIQAHKDKVKELQNLKKKEKELEETISKKDNSLDALKAQIDQLKSQIISLDSERKSSLKELDEWRSKFQSSDALVPKLTEKLKSLAISFKEIKTERDTLVTSLNSIELNHSEELATYKNNIGLLSTQNAELLSQNEDLTSKIVKLEQDLEKMSLEYEADKSSSLAAAQNIEQTVNTLKKELQDLLFQKNENEAKAAELEAKCQLLEKVIEKSELATVESESRITNAEKDLKLYQDKMSVLLEEKNNLEKNSDLQKSQLVDIQGQLRIAKKECEGLVKEIEESKSVHKDATERFESDIEGLRLEKQEESSNNAELNTKLAELREKYAIIEEQNSKNLQNSEHRNTMIEEERISAKAEMATLNGKIKDLLMKSKEHQKSLEKEQNKAENLENELKIAKSDNDEAKVETMRYSEENTNLKKATELTEVKIRELEKSKNAIMSEMIKLRKSFAENVAGLEEEVENLQAELKSKVQAFEKERSLLNEGSDSITQDYSEKVTTLEEKLNVAELRYKQKTKELELFKTESEQSKMEAEESLKKKAAEIESFESIIRTQKDEVEKTNMDLKTFASAKDKETSVLQDKIKCLEQSLTENAEQIESIKQELLQSEAKHKSFQEIIRKLEDEISLKDTNLKTLETQNSALRKDNETIVAEKVKIIAKLQKETEALSKHNKELEIKNSELLLKIEDKDILHQDSEKLKLRLKSLEEEFSSVKDHLKESKHSVTQYEEQLRSSNSDNDSLKAGIDASEKVLVQLRESIKEKDNALSKSEEQAKIASVKEHQEVEQLKNEISVLRNQNEELKSKFENSSEIDDLMLLVTDLDEKNAKYRSKLKELGVEVTSEEEEEENEDDVEDSD